MRDKLDALYARADDISMRIGEVFKRQPDNEADISRELRKERSLIWDEIVIVEEMLGFGREVDEEEENEGELIMQN
jgi:hypothetical protein